MSCRVAKPAPTTATALIGLLLVARLISLGRPNPAASAGATDTLSAAAADDVAAGEAGAWEDPSWGAGVAVLLPGAAAASAKGTAAVAELLVTTRQGRSSFVAERSEDEKPGSSVPQADMLLPASAADARVLRRHREEADISNSGTHYNVHACESLTSWSCAALAHNPFMAARTR